MLQRYLNFSNCNRLIDFLLSVIAGIFGGFICVDVVFWLFVDIFNRIGPGELLVCLCVHVELLRSLELLLE